MSNKSSLIELSSLPKTSLLEPTFPNDGPSSVPPFPSATFPNNGPSSHNRQGGQTGSGNLLLPDDDKKESELKHKYHKNQKSLEILSILSKNKNKLAGLSKRIEANKKEVVVLTEMLNSLKKRYTRTDETKMRSELQEREHPDRVYPLVSDISAFNGSAGGAIMSYASGKVVAPAMNGPFKNQMALVTTGFVPGNVESGDVSNVMNYIFTGKKDPTGNGLHPRKGVKLAPRNLQLMEKHVQKQLPEFLSGKKEVTRVILGQYPKESKELISSLIEQLSTGGGNAEVLVKRFFEENAKKSGSYKALNSVYNEDPSDFNDLGEFIKGICAGIRAGYGQTLSELIEEEMIELGEVYQEFDRAFTAMEDIKSASVDITYNAFEGHAFNQCLNTAAVKASSLLSIVNAYVELTGRALSSLDVKIFYFFAGVLKGKSDLQDTDNSQYQAINSFVKNICCDNPKVAKLAAIFGIVGYLCAGFAAKQMLQADLNLLKNIMKFSGKLLETAAALLTCSGTLAAKAAYQAFTAAIGGTIGIFMPAKVSFKVIGEFASSIPKIASTIENIPSSVMSRVIGFGKELYNSSEGSTKDYANYMMRGFMAFCAQASEGMIQALCQKKIDPLINAKLREIWDKVLNEEVLSQANIEKEVKKRNQIVDARAVKFQEATRISVQSAMTKIEREISRKQDEIMKLSQEKSGIEADMTIAGQEDTKPKYLPVSDFSQEEEKYPVPKNMESLNNKDQQIAFIAQMLCMDPEHLKQLIVLDEVYSEQGLDDKPVRIEPELGYSISPNPLVLLEAAGIPINLLGSNSGMHCLRALEDLNAGKEIDAMLGRNNDSEQKESGEGLSVNNSSEQLKFSNDPLLYFNDVELAQLQSLSININKVDPGFFPQLRESLVKVAQPGSSSSMSSSSTGPLMSSGVTVSSESLMSGSSSSSESPTVSGQEIKERAHMGTKAIIHKQGDILQEFKMVMQRVNEELYYPKEKIELLVEEIDSFKKLFHAEGAEELEESALSITDFNNGKDESRYVEYLKEELERIVHNQARNLHPGKDGYVTPDSIIEKYNPSVPMDNKLTAPNPIIGFKYSSESSPSPKNKVVSDKEITEVNETTQLLS